MFCGSCLERQFACVSHDTAVECLDNFDTTEHKDHEAGAQLAPVRGLADECQVPDVDISDIAVHPLAYDAIQRRRQHRKDNRRRKWERLKSERPVTVYDIKVFDRGVTAVETMMSGLRDFYNGCATQHDEQTSKIYQTISHSIAKELQDFHNSAAEGWTSWARNLEFCTADDSMMGKVGKDSGVHVIRCSESHLNVEDKGTMKVLYNIVDTKPGVDLWGSLPCDPWSQWHTLNVHQYGQAFADDLEARRQKSRVPIRKICKLARAVTRRGGRVSFEWPRFCMCWSDQELQKLIWDLDMVVVDFDGCQVG